MTFVIKATAPGEIDLWITPPRLNGHRTFAARKFAEVFHSAEDAASAMFQLQKTEICAALVFVLEHNEG